MAVTSILSEAALTTYAIAKAELLAIAPLASWSDDALQNTVERLINVASEAIAKHCGRDLHYGESEIAVVPPRGNFLRLTRCPIAEAVPLEILLDDGAITDAEVQDAAAGIVYLEGGWGGETAERGYPVQGGDGPRGLVTSASLPGIGDRSLEVTYTGGWVTPSQAAGVHTPAWVRSLPWSLEHACLVTVAYLWRMRQSGYTEQPDKNTAIGRSTNGILPDVVIPILQTYRVTV